jgi:uncharacterized membrane protein YfcA
LSFDATFAAAAAVIFAASLVSGMAGFAFSALAGAALISILGDPVRAVAAIVVCSIANQAYCLWVLRREIEWRLVRHFIAGGIATVPAGVWLLTTMPKQAFALLLGSLVTAYGVYMISRGKPPTFRSGPLRNAAAGALGGIAGGMAGFPGSFVAIWCGLQGWTKERQRAIYQPYILAMQLEALALLQWKAPAAVHIDAIVWYVPAAVAATAIGLVLFRRVTQRQFTLFVNVLLIVSGVALLAGAA